MDTRTRLLPTLLILALAACTPRVDLPREQVPPPAPPEPGESTSPSITFSPVTAAPGDEVRIEATGMPALTDVVVGFGPPESEYDVLNRLATDADGLVSTIVEVPEWAGEGRPYVWVVATPDNQVRIVSQEFLVGTSAETQTGATDEDASLIRIEGIITDEGVECPAVRTDDGTLYTLAGAPEDIAPGDRVQIVGAVAEMSFCQQGTTISVQEVQRL